MKDILMLDCDGTSIYSSNHLMSDLTYDILTRAQEKFYIVFNTGRNLKQFFEVIGKDQIVGDYVIALNGKTLYDLKNNKYIHEPSEEFTLKEMQNIIKIAKNYTDVSSHFFEKTDYYNNPTHYYKGVVKYIARSKNQEQIQNLFEQIKDNFNGYFCELARVGGKAGKWIELWKSPSNKKDLVPLVLKQIPNHGKLYYFGDSDNDLEVIKLADIKVVPQNAIAELKQLADIVLQQTCDQDAVAKYIQTLI